MREVSEAELARFQQQLQEAALSLDSREARVAAVYSGLEVGLTLLGATAVEDRLQEEVGDTLCSDWSAVSILCSDWSAASINTVL